MCWAHSFQTLIALILWVSIARSSLQPAGFTTWFWQDSVVVGKWLYIDGGAQYIGEQQVITNYTVAIDLSQSWTNSSVPAVITNKPSSFPFARRASLWYDAESGLVYSLGGFPFFEANGSTIWAFKPDGKGHAPWEKLIGETDQLWNEISPAFGGLTAISNGSFYSLGGVDPPVNEVFAGVPTTTYPGMAVFDDQSSHWKNISSSGYESQGYGVLGQAEFIPIFGKNGTIVFVGGDAPTGPSWSYCEGSSLVDMGTVTIYDVESEKWLQQKTTGDIPRGRYAFCMVGAGETSTGSYELFVYGGLSHTESGQQQTSDFFDMFLLSLPSFSWTRINTPVPQMRASHKCQVIGHRHMLVIGGHDPSSSNFGGIPDAFANGLGIFDMSNLVWAENFDPGADDYVRPSLINDYYANNKSSPTWNSPRVSSIFAITASSTPITASTTPIPNPISTSSSSHHHTAIGAIIGGIIGGVAAALITLILGWCFIKRRRRQSNQPIIIEPMHSSPRSELEQPAAELEGGARLHKRSELDNSAQTQLLMRAELDASQPISQ